MRKIFVIVAFLAAFLAGAGAAPGSARADFYKYTDENGVIHFTNVPTSTKFKWVMREMGTYGSRGAGTTIDDIINSTSRKWGVDPVLIKAVIKTESNFNPRAVSRAGARGLMQLMPKTAKLMGVSDVEDPAENINGGVRYLKFLLDTFESDVPKALAAYNAGLTAVRKYGDIPPYKETRNYVKKVLNYRKIYASYSR